MCEGGRVCEEGGCVMEGGRRDREGERRWGSVHSRFYLKKHLEARDSSIISRTRCLQRYQHHFSNFALVSRGREVTEASHRTVGRDVEGMYDISTHRYITILVLTRLKDGSANSPSRGGILSASTA